MKNKSGVVYIVHHVDTEGPLKEPAAEVFKRIESTFGINISVAKNEINLKKLSKGELDLGDPQLSKEIMKVVDPHLLVLNSNWNQVDKMLFKILPAGFRNKFKDSFGGGWIFNWHIMDHVGFKTNERGRDLGYLKVFDHYQKILKKTDSRQDRIHWHFHPVSFFKEAHISATSYENSYPEIHQILSRRLLEKNWFPRVNRAGFHTERPDSNWFLEQWIPFDPSSQAILGEKTKLQKDAINGRYGDWRGAPSDWSLYHPDLYDWRKKGAMNRVIARVLNMHARFRNINGSEIEKAFVRAKNGDNVYLGICNHDWRDMELEINDFREMLIKVSKNFPDIKFKFSESIEAFRKVLNYPEKEIKKNAIDFETTFNGEVLKVKVKNGEPFGPQPYLAIKTTKGEYLHDNFDFGEFKQEYFYTFDRYTVPLDQVDQIAIASNDRYGNTCIKKLTI